jgi:predicted DNA-binding transcriptional regulator YafY
MAYKHDYDTILTRLTQILSKLNNGEALSVKELAEEFNTSPRTIQRDFNERLISFPIYKEGRRWKMQEGFRIEKSKSIEDELVLSIIEKITEGIGGKFATKSQKILSKIKNDDFNPIYTKLNIEDISDNFADIQLLEGAIKEKLEIECSYNNEYSKVYSTTIQALKIVNFEGFWYLLALRGKILKKYYLKNISNIKVTEKRFKTDTKVETLLDDAISIWFSQENEPFEVKLYADSSCAKYFKRRPLPTQSIVNIESDGSMEFTLKITHEMEILSIIKYWIPHLFVIEPQWIDKRLEEDLVKYAKNKTTKEIEFKRV